MIESMTGFGRSECADDHGTVLVEMASVNGRYLKIHARTPEGLAPLGSVREAEIERLIRGRVSRGTVSVSVRLKAAEQEAAYRVRPAGPFFWICQWRVAMK